MNADRNGTLPAPHDCIEIRVSHWYDDKWSVEYTGTPQALVAAGIVDNEMERKIRSKQRGARIGADGAAFRIKSRRLPQCEQWELGDRLTLLKMARGAKTLKLAGVRDLFPNGLPTQKECDADIRANPGRGDTVGRVVSRVRAVSRAQRLMRWSLINDTVIAPDWAWMIRERVAGGAS